MHKIETNSVGLNALAIITLQSLGTGAFISLSTDKASKLTGETWIEDSSRLKQFVVATFDGDPVKLSGLVPEGDAVECAAAHKVVLEVEVSAKNLPAFAAGRMSRTLVGLEIAKVLEVWATPTKCVYDATKASKVPTGGEIDMSTGRVTRAS